MHVSGLEFLYRRDLGMVVQLEEVLVIHKNFTDLLRLLAWNWISEETLKIQRNPETGSLPPLSIPTLHICYYYGDYISSSKSGKVC